LSGALSFERIALKGLPQAPTKRETYPNIGFVEHFFPEIPTDFACLPFFGGKEISWLKG